MKIEGAFHPVISECPFNFTRPVSNLAFQKTEDRSLYKTLTRPGNEKFRIRNNFLKKWTLGIAPYIFGMKSLKTGTIFGQNDP